MQDLDQVKQAFLQESAALLADMAAGLGLPRPFDTLPAAGRSVHAIRSGAASFAMEALAETAQSLETVLERVNDGGIAASAEVAALLARAAALLQDMVQAAEAGMTLSPEHGADVLSALGVLGGDEFGDTDAGGLGHNGAGAGEGYRRMAPPGDERQFLTVDVADETYAIDLCAVRKVARRAEVADEDLPVVDLRRLCGLAAAPAGGRHPAVILDAGARRIALWVDAARDILTVGAADIGVKAGAQPWLSGWLSADQTMTPLLAVDRLCDDDILSSCGKW